MEAVTTAPALLLFRRDLRLADNPALAAAAASGAPVIPVFIFDESEPFSPGGAAKWWLHHSLSALSSELARAGAPLVLRRGKSADVIARLVEETGAAGVFWNRRYAPALVAADRALKAGLESSGAAVRTFNAALLREPWEAVTKGGTPFRVFTPFLKRLDELGPSRSLVSRPAKIHGLPSSPSTDRLDDWRLLPVRPDWAREFGESWRPGEAGASAALESFLEGPAAAYAGDRDRPDRRGTSRLSPHLAFGEIGPLQIWTAANARMQAGDLQSASGAKYLSEIAWREFAHHLLYFNEGLEARPLRPEFEDFPWRDDPAGLAAWKKGMTGYPLVDAGMRELWRTGWMHNRVRMITASFLVKDLLLPWQAGAAWFWDTLVDADPANNSASWQWVAGCGADAAPYFRIFNPVSQGEKFDPAGDYVRRFVPELARLPDDLIHQPWTAPAATLSDGGVDLGVAYPRPIVDHAVARRRALDAYAESRARHG